VDLLHGSTLTQLYLGVSVNPTTISTVSRDSHCSPGEDDESGRCRLDDLVQAIVEGTEAAEGQTRCIRDTLLR
jgi:hypothetical protein